MCSSYVTVLKIYLLIFQRNAKFIKTNYETISVAILLNQQFMSPVHTICINYLIAKKISTRKSSPDISFHFTHRRN